jgi:hypothetical protein
MNTPPLGLVPDAPANDTPPVTLEQAAADPRELVAVHFMRPIGLYCCDIGAKGRCDVMIINRQLPHPVCHAFMQPVGAAEGFQRWRKCQRCLDLVAAPQPAPVDVAIKGE